jgi:TorA maturation chaperone TorD
MKFRIIRYMLIDNKSHEHNSLKGYNMLLYFAGSMIMHEPSEECIVDFWKKGILKNLPVSSGNPHFIKAASQLRDSCLDSTLCLKTIQEDYTLLFSGEGPAHVPAYESFYRKSTSGYNSSDVTKFYNSYGWESKFKRQIDDDHLGTELLFLTVLIEKYISFDDEACRNEMRREIRRFIDLHLLSWIPEWNDKMQLSARTFSFKGIATLIFACTEDVYNILGYTTQEAI